MLDRHHAPVAVVGDDGVMVFRGDGSCRFVHADVLAGIVTAELLAQEVARCQAEAVLCGHRGAWLIH